MNVRLIFCTAFLSSVLVLSGCSKLTKILTSDSSSSTTSSHIQQSKLTYQITIGANRPIRSASIQTQSVSQEMMLIRSNVALLSFPEAITQVDGWQDISGNLDANFMIDDVAKVANVSALVVKAALETAAPFPVRLVQLDPSGNAAALRSLSTSVSSVTTINFQASQYFYRYAYKLQANLYHSVPGNYSIPLIFRLEKVDGNTTLSAVNPGQAVADTTSTDLPVWALNAPYKKGDRVYRNAAVYECLQSHVSYAPEWEPLNTLGILWIAKGTYSGTTVVPIAPTAPTANTSVALYEWTLNTAYSTGANVGYLGKSYSCLQAHTSYDPNWSPDKTNGLLWKETGAATTTPTTPSIPVNLNLSVSGVADGGSYPSQVLINATAVSGAVITAKIDGASYTLGTLFSSTGSHKLVVSAANGLNSDTKTIYFTISTPTPVTPAPISITGKKVVAYFLAWGVYGRNYQVSDLKALLDQGKKVTHVNYAFFNIQNDEVVLGDPYADIDKFYPGDSWDAGALRGNFNQLIKLKQAYPGLKTLMSIGGWTWSDGFSAAAATDAARKKFAASAINLMLKYQFDGIDLDWEYPGGGGLAGGSASDGANFVLLLAEIRSQLNALKNSTGRDYLITVASSAGYDRVASQYQLSAMAPYLDWFNIMTYDFHGTWETTTHFNAPLFAAAADPSNAAYNVSGAVQAYLNLGVPAEKIVVGLAFYGRSYANVGSSSLFQSFQDAGPGSWDGGVLDYKDIKNNYIDKGYTRYFDANAKVPYLYSADKKVFISYDDPESIQAKVNYVNQNSLGGVMFWDLTSDDGTLLGTVTTTLN